MVKYRKLARVLAWLALAGVFVASVSGLSLYLYLEPRLPEIDVLRDVQLQEPLRVYTRDGKLIAEYGDKRRIPLSIEETPELLQKAFVASEDDRFYEHPGVDWMGIVRAAVLWAVTGDKAQGGSTITMQVARNFFLTREKTVLRKLNEMLLALKISRELSKDKVLELYLNKIYLGKRAYGVAAAAQVYYGKSVDELTLAEIAMIAGLPKAPSSYNPVANPERALLRRNYVLGRMLELEMISQEAYELARAAPVTAEVHVIAPEAEANYLGEMVRAEITSLYPGEAYSAGLKVYTTVDSVQQRAAGVAVRQGLMMIDRRHGYRGPLEQLEQWLTAEDELDVELVDEVLAKYERTAGLRSALVTGVSDEQAELYLAGGEQAVLSLAGVEWARRHISVDVVGDEVKAVGDVLSPGDVVRVALGEDGALQLAQLPEVEGALVALDPSSGAVTALVGGFDYFKSKFNRATQARRQAGSSFKPFLYTAALENGYTPASVINDAPVVFDDPSLESKWKPENYSGKFYGPTRLRVALRNSRNLVSIRLLLGLGVTPVRHFAQQFGFDPEQLPRDLSLALGSGTVTPLELVSAFAIFANGGYRVQPYFIDRIEDAQGRVIYATDRQVACLPCLKPDAAPAAESEAEASTEATAVAEVLEAEVDQREEAASPVLAEGESAELGLPEGEGAEEFVEVEPVLSQAERVLNERTAFIIRDMLQDVVRRGTARRALALGRTDLAGKTGTTNDQIDAWFSGFNDRVVASVWVGHDSLKTLGRRETGSSAALPIWVDFMREALAGTESRRYQQPAGVVSIRIDPITGLLAHPEQQDAVFEYFREENVPTTMAVPTSPPLYQEAGENGEAEGEPEPESLF